MSPLIPKQFMRVSSPVITSSVFSIVSLKAADNVRPQLERIPLLSAVYLRSSKFKDSNIPKLTHPLTHQQIMQQTKKTIWCTNFCDFIKKVSNTFSTGERMFKL